MNSSSRIGGETCGARSSALPANVQQSFIDCVLAAGEVQARLRAQEPRPPVKPRPHVEPAKRRNNPFRDYGLRLNEYHEWRRLMSHKGFTALEAANIMIRSRKVRR